MNDLEQVKCDVCELIYHRQYDSETFFWRNLCDNCKPKPANKSVKWVMHSLEIVGPK